jgi:hypothetical protein
MECDKFCAQGIIVMSHCAFNPVYKMNIVRHTHIDQLIAKNQVFSYQMALLNKSNIHCWPQIWSSYTHFIVHTVMGIPSQRGVKVSVLNLGS